MTITARLSRPSRLLADARANGGLFTRAMAHECGYSNDQIRRRIATTEWQVVLGQVLALAGLSLTPSVRDRAAVMAVPGSVLSGASALRSYGLGPPDDRTWLTVPVDRRVRIPGIHIRREAIPASDVAPDLPVTSRPRAVFDTLRALPVSAADKLLDQALQQRLITFDDLVRRVHDHAGKRGVNHLVTLVRRAAPGARSTAERILLSWLRRSRLSGWTAQLAVFDEAGLIGEVDVGFEAVQLAIEVDGRAWHSADERFENDRRRQNRLVRAGWTVLRFTWRDLHDRPDEVLAEITAIARQLRVGARRF